MRLSAASSYFIRGHGWMVGPVTDENKAEVLRRVIAILEWALKTRLTGEKP